MKKIALQTLFAASILGVSGTAAAQNCPPGSWLCADVQIGGGFTQPQPPPPPPPPPQYVQPPPQYVQPPPPTVVYQPPPQPYVVYQQPRFIVTTTPTYAYVNQPPGYGWLGSQQFGIGAHVAGLGLPGQSGSGSSAGLGGFGAQLRFRTHPYFATELAVDYFNGHDYNGDLRSEVPVTLSELFYFNPQNRFQFYGLVGVGGSAANVQYEASHGGVGSGSYGYLGGQIGLGFEWQISHHFSLYSDVRGFLRTRVDATASSNPEFTRTDRDGNVETSNTSIGATFQAGGILYL